MIQKGRGEPGGGRRGGGIEEEVEEDQSSDFDHQPKEPCNEKRKLSASNSENLTSIAADDLLLPVIAYDPKEAAKPRSPAATATVAWGETNGLIRSRGA
jgi:hypothetical protein